MVLVADPIRAAMDNEKYIIEESQTQNVYEEDGKNN